MSYVNVTLLTIPEGAGEEVEKRFAARARGVDQAPGFQSFELWRPVKGEDRYYVVTRWDSAESYQHWADNRVAVDHSDDTRRGMSIEVLGFEAVQIDKA